MNYLPPWKVGGYRHDLSREHLLFLSYIVANSIQTLCPNWPCILPVSVCSNVQDCSILAQGLDYNALLMIACRKFQHISGF